MVIKAQKFTPEVLLSTPRLGSAVPNHDGTLALYSVWTYSFDDHEPAKEIRILDVKRGTSTLFTSDSEAHDAQWLGDGTNALMWLQSGEKGITNLMIGDGDEPDKASYIADVILAPFSNLKLKPLSDGTIACAMSGLATPEGSLYNIETADKPKSSARIYDALNVRYWNKYLVPQRSVIWYSKLAKSDGKYNLAAPVHNALKGTDFECPFDDGLSDPASAFDIGVNGILFTSLKRSESLSFTKPSVYFVPLTTFTEEEASTPQRIHIGDYAGFSMNPRFSPCGKKAALLATPKRDFYSETHLLLVPDLGTSLHAVDICNTVQSSWGLFPNSFVWSLDGKYIYLTAEDCGRVKLFSLSLSSIVAGRETVPQTLTHDGTVLAYYNLGTTGQKLLVTSNSLIDNSTYSIIDCDEPENRSIVYSWSRNGLKLGLSPSQVSEIWFEGAGDYCVQAWVVKPSYFDDEKKYPLALLIHGGPQSSWPEAWSTRWNPAVWAEQGYVVVMPNLTGSTGFGVDFLRGIYGEWGGRAYEDLDNCFEYVNANMSFVDTDNAIAAGASYGGYMVNWLQGNPLGRKFKALVCHDGVFDTQMSIAGDVVDIETGSDFKGPMLPWVNYKNLEMYNPARHDLLKNWKTPMLVIHSDLDYRCLISDGLAAFGVCQALGTPSKFLNFPDECHWVLKPENSLVWHQTVFDWINHYSGITKRKAELARKISAPSASQTRLVEL